MKMKQRVAAVVATSIAALGLAVSIPEMASAHDNAVVGQASCSDDGTHVVVWTITNNFNLTETSYVQSFTGGGSLDKQSVDIDKNGSGTITQSGIDKNVANINIHSVWSDDFKKDDTGHVKFSDDCQPAPKHTTVSATFTEGSVSCVYGEASYVQPSFTKSSKHVSWDVQGDADFGSTVTLTATPDKGWVIDGESVFTHTFDAKPNAPDCRNEVTPVSPTIEQPVCTGPGTHSTGSFTLPDNADGIKYTADGTLVYAHIAVVEQGNKVFAIDLPDGWTRVSDVEATYQVTFTYPGKCLVKTQPVNPTVAECRTDDQPFVTIPDNGGGVFYSGPDSDQMGTVFVTATTADGYRFAHNAPEGWKRLNAHVEVFVIQVPPQCDLVITPTAPSVEQGVCKDGQGTDGSITVVDGPGLLYEIDGQPATGTTSVKPGEHTVTVAPDKGYVFPEGTKTSYAVDIKSVNCVTPVPPVITHNVATPHQASLAFTGAFGIVQYSLGSVAVLALGVLFFFVIGRRRPGHGDGNHRVTEPLI